MLHPLDRDRFTRAHLCEWKCFWQHGSFGTGRRRGSEPPPPPLQLESVPWAMQVSDAAKGPRRPLQTVSSTLHATTEGPITPPHQKDAACVRAPWGHEETFLVVVFFWHREGLFDWWIQPSILGAATWRRDRIQGTYPKTENSTDLSHYFLGRSPNSLWMKMSDLPPASGVPQIIENVTEVDILYVEEKCAFLIYESWL